MTVYRFLLVEDDEAFQHYMKTLFRRYFPDFIVAQVYDGAEALEYIKNPDNQLPDHIFLDLNMPGMNGFEFLDEWDQNHQDKGVIISILTSSQDGRDRERIDNYMFVGNYLTKPVSKEAIEALLSKEV